MSLINDALKRAAQAPPPANPQQAIASMRVEYPHRSFPWVILIAVLIPVFVLAAWFLVKGWQLSRIAEAHGSELIANARTNESAPAPVPTTAMIPVPAPVLAAQTNAVSVPAPTNKVTAHQPLADPPKPTFPALKLQGIFWRPEHPSAVINSKTVYKGDRVDTARVIAIDQETVTVQWQSETKVLTLQ